MTPFIVDDVHSEVGASISDRWLNCQGSVLLTRGMPDPGSWYAAEGSAAHTVSEWARRENRSAYDFKGRVLKVGEHEFTVDDEMAGGVDEFVSAVEMLPGVPLYEVKVHYDRWVPGGFGTLDDGRLNEEVFYTSDLKYGAGIPVTAKDNSQLKIYNAGELQDFGWLFPNVKLFVNRIYQPRRNHIDEVEIKKSDLLEWMEYEVKPIAERALLPGAPLKAGDWCQFCPAKRTCKVRAQFVLQGVTGDFANLDAPQDLALLTNDEVAKLLPHLPHYKKWCDDIEAHALAERARGNAVGGWKVVEGRSVRAYSADEGEVARRLEPELGGELWESPKLKSPAKVETALKAKYKGVLKGEARDDRVAEILAPIVKKPRGKATLAPPDDPRQEMVVDVTTDFKDLDAEE